MCSFQKDERINRRRDSSQMNKNSCQNSPSNSHKPHLKIKSYYQKHQYFYLVEREVSLSHFHNNICRNLLRENPAKTSSKIYKQNSRETHFPTHKFKTNPFFIFKSRKKINKIQEEPIFLHKNSRQTHDFVFSNRRRRRRMILS